MKILLVNPASRIPIDDKRERYFIKAGSRWPWSYIKDKKSVNKCCFFPFFLAYTANVLRQDNHEVSVIDGVAMDMKEADFLRRVKDLQSELIVLETATHSIKLDLDLCIKIKKLLPKIKILFCGAHATVCAHELLNENQFIDFITLGEYELTIRELVRRLVAEQKDLRMEGLGYRTGNDVWVSEVNGFIKDINVLPMPAFDLFPANDTPKLSIYNDGICTYFPSVTLHSSRGCPFKCDFCMWNQIMYGNGHYRMFDPLRVVDEMELVINKFGAREIYFDDDDFCVNKKHVLNICSEIKKRKLDIKWSCMGDAMVTDEEMIKAMAGSGCIFMKFGVESGSTEILKNIGKPLKPERAIQVAKWCKQYGMYSHATFSFGLDGETEKTMRQTLELANRIPFDYAQVSITTPFPGTRYFTKLFEKGWLKTNGWEFFDGTSSCVFDTPDLSASQIQDFRKIAIRSMVIHKVLDPIWLWRFMRRNMILMRSRGISSVLEPIRSFFGLF